jgi:hypothetical protein
VIQLQKRTKMTIELQRSEDKYSNKIQQQQQKRRKVIQMINK